MAVQSTYRERALPWKIDERRTIERNGEKFDVYLLASKAGMKVIDNLGTTVDITHDSSGKFAVFWGGSSGGLFPSVPNAVNGAARMCIHVRTRLTEAEARAMMEAYFHEVPSVERS